MPDWAEGLLGVFAIAIIFLILMLFPRVRATFRQILRNLGDTLTVEGSRFGTAFAEGFLTRVTRVFRRRSRREGQRERTRTRAQTEGRRRTAESRQQSRTADDVAQVESGISPTPAADSPNTEGTPTISSTIPASSTQSTSFTTPNTALNTPNTASTTPKPAATIQTPTCKPKSILKQNARFRLNNDKLDELRVVRAQWDHRAREQIRTELAEALNNAGTGMTVSNDQINRPKTKAPAPPSSSAQPNVVTFSLPDSAASRPHRPPPPPPNVQTSDSFSPLPNPSANRTYDNIAAAPPRSFGSCVRALKRLSGLPNPSLTPADKAIRSCLNQLEEIDSESVVPNSNGRDSMDFGQIEATVDLSLDHNDSNLPTASLIQETGNSDCSFHSAVNNAPPLRTSSLTPEDKEILLNKARSPSLNTPHAQPCSCFLCLCQMPITISPEQQEILDLVYGCETPTVNGKKIQLSPQNIQQRINRKLTFSGPTNNVSLQTTFPETFSPSTDDAASCTTASNFQPTVHSSPNCSVSSTVEGAACLSNAENDQAFGVESFAIENEREISGLTLEQQKELKKLRKQARELKKARDLAAIEESKKANLATNPHATRNKTKLL